MSASEEVAAVGDAQRFECQVVGYPSPNVTWYKDEVDITNNPRYNIHYDKDRGVIALAIRRVLPTDEGCYQCRAQNSEGYATTTAYLVVKVEHGLSRGFRSMLVSEKATEQEMSQVQMASADKQRVFEEVITGVEETEKEVIEEKLFPPKLTYDRALGDGVQLKSGSTLYIEVGVSGIPFPDVTWHHGDAHLQEDARLTMETESGYAYLKLKGTTQEDAGTYKVTAENTVGKDEAAFSVTVKAPPSPPRNLRVIEVYKDYITIAWDKPEHDNGFPITGYIIEKSLSGGMFVSVNQVLASEFEYKITRLYEGSEYKFRVMAENKIGVSVPATMEQPVKARLPFDPPGKPRGLAVTSVDKDAVGLRWEAPETDGGALITSYIVEKKDVSRTSSMWAIAGTVEGTKFEFLVPKLFTGNCYHFRVFAENRVGPGEPATVDDGVIAKLPYDKPMPARNIRAIETNVDYIVIEWDEPEHDGGSPITAYVIEKRDAKRREFIYIADVPGDVRSFKATRLFEGYEYFFRVFAENIVGASEPCEMSKAAKAKLPYDEPLEPRNLRVTDYWTDFVSLQWDAPTSDGGSPLTGYVIEKRDALRQTWVKAGNVGPDVDNFKVTNLFEGTEYVFRVFAENKVGPSLKACELDKSVKAKMPFDPPFAPQSLKTSDVNADRITVSWGAPANDGGSPITRYVVEKRDAMRATWGACGHTEPGTCTLVVEGLIEGDNYFFRVAAENQVGRGEYVELVHPITAKLPYTKPSKPTGLRTTEIWNTYIVLAWDAPKDDGGSPVTGYNIEVRDTMKAGFKFVASVNASTTSFQVTNLEEGHDYYFRVFAENKAGLSDAAAELKPAVKAQLPYNRPGPPSTIKVIGTGKATISITWTVPESDGGSPITGYIIEICPALSTEFSAVATVDASTTSYTIEDLKDGADYFVRVRSQNAAGISKDATQTELPIAARAPKTPPGPPTDLHVVAPAPDCVSLAWSPPDVEGGSPVTGYMVEVRPAGGEEPWTIAGRVTSTQYRAYGLHPRKKYDFRVKAINVMGPSNEGAELWQPVGLRPLQDPPSAPTNLRVKRIGHSSVTITWDEPESTGGALVSAYVIEVLKPGVEGFRPEGRVSGDKYRWEALDLRPGVPYWFRVRAETTAGPGDDWAVMTEPVSPLGKAAPSRPGAVAVKEVMTDSMTVTWKVPETDGGATITAYQVEVREVGGTFFTPVTVDGKTLSATIPGLSPDKAYEVQVSAKNTAGTSEPIMTAEATKTKPKPVEVKPEEVKPAEVKPAEVKPTEVKPAEVKPAEVKPAEVKPVEETPVQAEPAVKPAETAAPAQLTLPSAPKSLRVTDAQPDAVTIAWEAPESDGGSPVTHYVVVIKDVASSKKYKKAGRVDCNTMSLRITDKIKKGHEYMIAVYAENAAGVSTDGAELATPILVPEEKQAIVEDVIEVVEQATAEAAKPAPAEAVKPAEAPKPTEPAAPVNPHLDQVTSESITISWDAPTNDGGAEVTKYTICVRDAEKKKFKAAGTVDGKTTTYTIDKVKESHEYFIRVYAENEVGISTEGEVTTSIKVPTKKPEDTVDAGKFPAPEIVTAPEPVAVKEGETIRLTCKVKGDPEPEVEWYKDGKEVKPKRSNTRVKIDWDMKTDIYTLVINDATEADAGEYVVKAINSEGVKEVKVDVDVGETRVSRRRQDMSVTESLEVIEKTKKEADVTRRVEGEGSASITAEISEKKKTPEEEPKPVEEVVVEDVTPKVSKQPEAKAPAKEPTLKVDEAEATMTLEPEVTDEAKPSEPGPKVEPKKEPEAKAEAPSKQPTLEIDETEATIVIEPEVAEEIKPSELGPEITPKKEPEAGKPADTEVSEVVEPEITKDVKTKVKSEMEATVTIDTTEKVEPSQPKEKVTTTTTAEVEETAIRTDVTISETEVSETEATITIDTTEEDKPSQPEEKVTTTTSTEAEETAIRTTVGISETEVSEMEATITIDTTEEDKPSQPEEKVTTTTTTDAEETAIRTDVKVSETEVSETEATITIDTTEEDKARQPEENITTTEITEIVETQVAKDVPESKIISETEVSETEATITIDTTEQLAPSEPEEKITTTVVTEEIEIDETKEVQAKISTDTEVNADVSDVTEEAEFTVTIEADTTEEVEETKPEEEEVTSSVVIEEVETKIGKAPEATVSTEEETTLTLNVDTAASITLGEDTIEEVTTTKVKTEKVEASMKVESPSSSAAEESEDEKEPTPTKAKEKVILADTEVTEKVSVTEEAEASLTIEEVSEVSAESKSTETKVMTGVQKDVTQMTSGLQIVSIEGSEEESSEEEEPKVVGVQKDITQMTSGLKIVSIEGSEESSSEEEEEGTPPKFVQKPEPAVVNFGEEIRLVCKVSGDPEPEVTWFKGDKKLKQSKREPRLKIQWDMAQDLNILIITDATADDAGEYTVLAENDHGSFRFTVTILVGKTEGMEITKTTESKRTTTVVEETTVDGEVVDRTVKQEVSEDTPEVTVEKTVVTEKPAEVVEVVQEEGAAPKFEKPPEPMLVDLGETINLSCRVTGDPEPEVTWYKEGELIKPSKRDPRIKTHWDFKEDLNFLTIKDAKKEDEGKYTVIADNKFGSFKFSVTVLVGKPAGAEIIKTTESKRSVTVVEETIVDGEVVDRTVKEDVSESEPSTVVEKITVEESAPVESAPKEEGKPPKFVQAPEPVFVDFGETVKLTCKVEGTPKPEVQWYKAKSKIETGDRSEVKYSSDDDIHMLIIINATSDDAGEYTVIAENKFGSFKFTVTVLVGRPKGAEIVTKTTESKRSVKVIEETVVDGKVTQRVVQEDVSEDTPTEHIVKEEPILSHEAPSPETVRPSSEAIATEKVIVSQSDKDEVQVEGVITLGEDIDSDKVHKVLQDSKVTEETSTTSETFTIGAEESTKTALTQEATTLQTSSVTEATDTQKVLDDTVIIIEDKGEAPKFIQPPEPVFVDFGETVKLTCKVTGSPTPEVSWYRKGDPDKIVVKDDDHRVKPDFDEKQDLHILIILDAKADDAGDYTVIAENKYGSFKFTVTVLVGKPEGAEIVTKTVESKRSVKVVEETLVDGKVVERTVKEETSEETPDSQTKTEEAVIVSEKTPTDSKVEEATQKKVEESIIVSEDTTEVHATIKDIEITASDAATITATTTEVQKTKESVTSEETQKAVEPEPAVKEVVTVEKAVKTEVKKKPASESEESSSEESSSEEESSEEEPDKAPGKETGKPPKFSQPPEPVFVDIGETIKLTCKVTGAPTPKVTWYRAGEKLKAKPDNSRIKSEFVEKEDLHILIILEANPDDAGEYTVVAENIHGSFKFTVTVLVGKPEGAEIVTKKIESKHSVKVVEETVVDGKVVQKTLKEETSEDTPDSQTKVEKTLVMMEETPTESKQSVMILEEPSIDGKVVEEVKETVSKEITHSQADVKETIIISEEVPSVMATTTETDTAELTVVKAVSEENIESEQVRTVQGTVTEKTGEDLTELKTIPIKAVQEPKAEVSKKVAVPTKDSPSEESSSEESSSEVSSSEEEPDIEKDIKDGQPPKFTQPPEPVFVDVGETIKLICKVTGDPSPLVSWYKAETLIETKSDSDRVKSEYDAQQDLHILMVMDANLDDAGDYRVIAENKYGRFKFTVTVLVGKTEEAEVVKKTIESKRSVKVVEETVIDGKVVQRTIKEDTSEETPDSQTKAEETLILSEETPTVKTTTSQKGEIKVGEESFAESSVLLSSTDQFAEESSTTDISMEAEAVFVLEEHPQDETQDVVTVKEDASKSEDEAHVEHIIKSETSEMGEEMSSSETFTLYTSTEDTVGGEEIKSSVQEHVDKKAGVVAAGEHQPPKFIQTPEPVFVDIGETIKLTCKVSGDPEPKVTWFRGDAELSTSGRITVDQIDGTYTLTITEATEEDAGDYKVRATNTFGTFNFTVTVLVGKPAGSKIVEMTRKTTSVRETIVDGEVVEHLEKEDVQTEKFDETDSQSTTKVETSETKTLKQEVVEDVVTEEKTEKVESVKPKDDKAPKIDIPPEPVSVDEGETIRLTCKVSGDPEPEVCWYKGQDVIKPKKRDTRIQVNWDMSTDLNHLVVSDARLDDGGEYTMKAENKHGECSVTVIVKVGHQVEDKKQESVEEIVVEQVIEKDSVEVSEKEVIKATTEKDEEVSATIKLDAPEEEGAITKLSDVQEVEVSVSDTAEDSTTATAESVTTESVTIKEMTETVTKTEETMQEESQPAGAPKMEIAPKPVIVDVGEKVEITCKFSGDPEPEVNFYKNDKLIKNKKSDKRVQVDWNMKTDIYTLIIENATANDAGDYVIKAENSRGLIQFTVSVSIGKAGVIETSHTTTITEHTIVDGATMETVVHKETSTESSASGVPTIESTITETVAHEVMETKAPEVKDSPVDDTAKVTEVEEKVTEDVAKVTEVAEKVTKDVAKVTEAATKEVTEVSEVVKSSTETVKVAEKEKKDEEPMSEDSSLDSEASEEDDGAPTIEEAPVPVSVKLGETICLKCKVTGDPEPEVSWLRNDVEIKPKRHDKRVKIDWDMKQNLHILTITDATLEDAGEYAVKAENVNGGFTLKVTVVVSELSEQSTIVTKVETVEASDSTKFETGTSEDLKKSQSTIVETRTSTVVETTESDMVSGKSQMSVGVEGAPVLEEPPEPAAVPVGGTVRLTCRVTGDPEPDVTWYKAGKQIKPRRLDRRIRVDWDLKTDEQFLEIRNATEDDSGEYEMRAENSKGSTSFTVSVHVGESGLAGATYERRVVQSSSSTSSSSTSGSSLLSDPMFSDLSGSMRFSSRFK